MTWRIRLFCFVGIGYFKKFQVLNCNISVAIGSDTGRICWMNLKSYFLNRSSLFDLSLILMGFTTQLGTTGFLGYGLIL